MDNANATLDQFDYCSKAVAKLLRTFGVPADIEANLQSIAVWGADPTQWSEPWSDRIAALRDDDKPVRVRPWKNSDIEWSGRCANFAVAWLLAQLWQQLFPENPQFGNLIDDVPRYIAEHLEELTARFERLANLIDRNEWIDLAEKMEMERARLLAEFQQQPQPPKELAKEWTDWSQPKVAMTWFPSINSKRGWTTFATRLRNEGKLKNHPTTGDKLVSIHHSVFAMLGLTLPVNVGLIAL